ncbi:ArsR family transcriptional regulator [Candidatus Woesearchaeota archaeon]|nr:ArsR family transcriptional regulator [Candidatus Woesearchaeota archaeon]
MELLKAVSIVKRGKNRKKVFLALDKPMMPSELVIKIYGKSSNTYFNIVSRALTELKEKELVDIVNPEDRTGRIYQRTKVGDKVIKSL